MPHIQKVQTSFCAACITLYRLDSLLMIYWTQTSEYLHSFIISQGLSLPQILPTPQSMEGFLISINCNHDQQVGCVTCGWYLCGVRRWKPPRVFSPRPCCTPEIKKWRLFLVHCSARKLDYILKLNNYRTQNSGQVFAAPKYWYVNVKRWEGNQKLYLITLQIQFSTLLHNYC